jgi:hypothetical protein
MNNTLKAIADRLRKAFEIREMSKQEVAEFIKNSNQGELVSRENR